MSKGVCAYFRSIDGKRVLVAPSGELQVGINRVKVPGVQSARSFRVLSVSCDFADREGPKEIGYLDCHAPGR